MAWLPQLLRNRDGSLSQVKLAPSKFGCRSVSRLSWDVSRIPSAHPMSLSLTVHALLERDVSPPRVRGKRGGFWTLSASANRTAKVSSYRKVRASKWPGSGSSEPLSPWASRQLSPW